MEQNGKVLELEERVHELQEHVKDKNEVVQGRDKVIQVRGVGDCLSLSLSLFVCAQFHVTVGCFMSGVSVL